jgi:hypothetical protein
MPVQAGSAYISVRPDLTGFHKSVGTQLTGSLAPAAATAGTQAGRRISQGVTQATQRIGAGVGASISTGITRATGRIGDVVGTRISSRLGTAISGTGTAAGQRIGSGLESGVNSSLARVEQRGRSAGSQLYAVFRAPIARVGALGASVFGGFGLNAASAAALAGGAAIGMGVKFEAGME